MGKKREGMQRMLVIINKLKGPQQYVPRKELENYVTHRMEERDGTPVDNKNFAARLQRYRRSIWYPHLF